MHSKTTLMIKIGLINANKHAFIYSLSCVMMEGPNKANALSNSVSNTNLLAFNEIYFFQYKQDCVKSCTNLQLDDAKQTDVEGDGL